MRRLAAITVLYAALSAGCGGQSPTAPQPPPSPTPAPEVRVVVSGRVSSSGGAAVQGAEVEITSGTNAGQTRTTDGDGRFEFRDLQPGAMTLRATAAGFLAHTASITASADQTTDFVLSPSAGAPPPARVTLSGMVCTAASAGPPTCLAGADVEIVTGTNAGRETTTDPSGRYSFADLAPGDFVVRVSAAGFVAEERSVRLTSDESMDFALALEPFVTVGRVVDILSGEGVRDVRLSGDGFSPATTDAAGEFRLSVPVRPADPLLIVFSGPGVLERQTHVRIPGESPQVTLISTTFDLDAFNAMFRTPMLRRWTSAPPLVIQQRVVEFSGVEMTMGTGTDRLMTAGDADGLVEDLRWALPQLTGDTWNDFESVRRESATAGASVPLLVSGVITVCRVEGLTASTGYWGYGRWQQRPDGTVTGGLVMIDRGFDETAGTHRRSLRSHELGHALGLQHVITRPSVMHPDARTEPNAFDRAASRIAFLREPGNRSPDIDPDMHALNRHGAAIWSRPIR